MGSVTQFPETPTPVRSFEIEEKAIEAAKKVVYAIDSGAPENVHRAFREMVRILTPLRQTVCAEVDQSFCHGVALGLMYAGRPDLVFDFPEGLRQHVATMDGRTGADLRHYLRQRQRPQRRS
jgi:hypothetical protein